MYSQESLYYTPSYSALRNPRTACEKTCLSNFVPSENGLQISVTWSHRASRRPRCCLSTLILPLPLTVIYHKFDAQIPNVTSCSWPWQICDDLNYFYWHIWQGQTSFLAQEFLFFLHCNLALPGDHMIRKAYNCLCSNFRTIDIHTQLFQHSHRIWRLPKYLSAPQREPSLLKSPHCTLSLS